MSAAPQYLVAPEANGHSYGEVRYNAKSGHYEIRAEPAVMECAKRVFPGSRTKSGVLKFPATRRLFGELNWFLLRYPMDIKCAARFATDREKALEHAARRETNHEMAPTHPKAHFEGTLYEYQATGVSFLTHNQRALLADEMGLGKTVVALASLAATEAFPAVIVAPSSVQRQWVRMAEVFLRAPSRESLLQEQAHIIKGTKPYRFPDLPLHVIHYGLLDYWRDTLRDLGYKAIVFDEIQELRHTGTNKYSAASLLASDAVYCWGLSGTPVYNYGSEIWSVLNILDYHCLGDFDSFTVEWCDGYGTKVVKKPDVLGDYLRREGLMIRRRKADVQGELPPKRRIVMDIAHDESEYRKLINEARSLARDYAGMTDFHEKGVAARKIEGAVRRAAGVAKAPFVADFVASLIAAGERPLVFSYHHDVHNEIATKLWQTCRVVKITGVESPSDKEYAVRSFAGGDAQAALISLRCAAGLDGLQGVGTCVVFAELDWSPAVHSQCEDRLHRIGTEAESILCYYLVSSTGFDEVVQTALGLKVGQFVGLMGDDAPADTSGEARAHLQAIIEKLRK